MRILTGSALIDTVPEAHLNTNILSEAAHMYEPGHNYYERLQRSGNALLVKGDVGKAKPCTNPLPPPTFIYGQSGLKDRESAGSVIGSWDIHKVSKGPYAPTDFRSLNVLGLRNGLYTSKDLTKFRLMTDAKMKIHEGQIPPAIKPPDLTFGIKIRPSTPMVGVLSNSYGRAAYDERHEEYGLSKSFSKLPEVVQKKKATESTPQINLPKPEKSAFKMRKFLQTAPRTNTNLKKKANLSMTVLDLSKVIHEPN